MKYQKNYRDRTEISNCRSGRQNITPKKIMLETEQKYQIAEDKIPKLQKRIRESCIWD
jgi:hypothetical protein